MISNQSLKEPDPETPDNYCPVVNVNYEEKWQEEVALEDPVPSYPLEPVEGPSYPYESGSYTERPRRSPNRMKNRFNKSSSRDTLGYKDIHGNSSIIKAFKNSPCNNLLMEYFKNKTELDKKYKNSLNNN